MQRTLLDFVEQKTVDLINNMLTVSKEWESRYLLECTSYILILNSSNGSGWIKQWMWCEVPPGHIGDGIEV